MLEVLRLSRDADPLLPRFPARERIARCLRALDAVVVRLDSCDESPPVLLSEVGEIREDLRRARVPDPDLLERTLQVVLRGEHAAESCGPGTPLDRALMRIAERHQAGAQ